MIIPMKTPLLLELAVILCVLCCAVTADAQGSVVIESEFPTQDQPVRVHIAHDDGSPVSGASVSVTYRPGSSVERLEPIGVSAEDGGIDWVPSEAGIANVTATWTDAGQSEIAAASSVSIRYGSPPLGGIVIMVVAGILLVLGSIVRVFNLIRTPQAP